MPQGTPTRCFRIFRSVTQLPPGRQPVFAELQKALTARGRAALSGLGGVGKTQTAVEYAHRRSDAYACKFWATARLARGVDLRLSDAGGSFEAAGV